MTSLVSLDIEDSEGKHSEKIPYTPYTHTAPQYGKASLRRLTRRHKAIILPAMNNKPMPEFGKELLDAAGIPIETAPGRGRVSRAAMLKRAQSIADPAARAARIAEIRAMPVKSPWAAERRELHELALYIRARRAADNLAAARHAVVDAGLEHERLCAATGPNGEEAMACFKRLRVLRMDVKYLERAGSSSNDIGL